MTLKVIRQDFSICKLASLDQIDFTDEFCFVGKTDEEISLVCSTACVPAQALAREDGWRAFRIEGVLDFSLTGILSGISGILAEYRIGIFAVSTYNTDYILTRSGQFGLALQVLTQSGYTICGEQRQAGSGLFPHRRRKVPFSCRSPGTVDSGG